jgi:glycolate oxidase iron-sulfur subunit
MRTAFSLEQLADPEVAESAAQIRKCVHCGFCTATCPTYVLLADERDSPRGRIELIRAMLESGAPPTKATVTHIDRCLSCLACKTTCPSGVDYGQLIGHARAHIEDTYRRPWPERLLRGLLAWVLPHPARLRVALALGRLSTPLRGAFEGAGLKPLAAMLDLLPARVGGAAAGGEGSSQAEALAQPVPPGGRGRVALLHGCVESVVSPQIRAAAVRLIERAGFEVVEVRGEGCCGALSEHLGRADEARAMAAKNLRAWERVGPLDAIVTTAAGCGTTLKGYGHILGAAGAPAAAKARDILEFIGEAGLPPVTRPGGMAVAYHAPCSLQHGQGIKAGPAALLALAGFEVREPAEAHLCCGSAGVYNILQPKLAGELRDRKAANLARTGAAVVAAGNIGCMAQIAPALEAAVVHPVELLDWATGGPKPAALTTKV